MINIIAWHCGVSGGKEKHRAKILPFGTVWGKERKQKAAVIPD